VTFVGINGHASEKTVAKRVRGARLAWKKLICIQHERFLHAQWNSNMAHQAACFFSLSYVNDDDAFYLLMMMPFICSCRNNKYLAETKNDVA
jgi:hypothetical protein